MVIRFNHSAIAMLLMSVGAAALSDTAPQHPAAEASAARRSHWAYQPIQRPVIPRLSAPRPPEFIRNPIDLFVLEKLQARKLMPAPEADRRTLARRIFLDLLGLPPSPVDVEQFLADSTPDAYDKLVDRVLASPHFGERMAMYWLDLVRYGDTNGYHADVHRHVFPYRDYVIDAFNSNRPFDQFTVEQLAGDLLPQATLEQKVASAYNRMNMITTEGGAQAKEYLAKYAADRVRNVSTAWLASTLGCAECHDHKYDPFKASDFYRFAAYFADIKQVGVYPNTVDLDPQLKVPTTEQSAELNRLDRRLATLQQTLDTQTAELDAAQLEWERSIESLRIRWLDLRPAHMTSQNGTTLELLDDGSILAKGDNPDSDVYTIAVDAEFGAITAIGIEVLPHESLPQNGPGRASNGNFVLSHLSAQWEKVIGEPAAAVELMNATATYEQKGGNLSVAGAIDPAKKESKSGWAVADQIGRRHRAVFETKESFGNGGRSRLTIQLQQTHGTGHTLGRFRLFATSAERPVSAMQTKFRGIPDRVAEILLTPRIERTNEQSQAIAQHYRSIAPLLEATRKEHAELKQQRDQLYKSIPITLYTVAVEPAMTRILPRGNWMDDSGEIVPAGPPQFLAQAPEGHRSTDSAADRCNTDDQNPGSRTRLELARWITAPTNPLTARVFVNRLWKLMFGHGIVRTTDDFGTQGAPPTHPELLDWLAHEFVDSGWDVKYLVRLLVRSGTYRQSSHASSELYEADPNNEWLARQGRFRLDAEMIRDNALHISDLMTCKIGGRSVKPYQPDGYWDHCNTFQGKLIYDQDHGGDLYRRGLYTYWKRTFLHPAFLAFDAPSREECTAERPRSNTPLQALVLLNDPTYVEAARAFAERIIRECSGSADDRIEFAFHTALSRPARPDEKRVLSDLLAQHTVQYRLDPDSAKQLTQIGEWPAPRDISEVELAAWTSIARVILNLHETITRY